ncbi:uracil-DNA glycosylase family protein [Sphingomonas sp.]|jgi:hypothetical protein|uniref:uracil-DNA glycosylase family protein n=1 Tax=Sphingomonas sp. TaxID=28214 RepID=UPI002E0DC077|nr:uracil-DNA glycosylase family protein [Sphingomonas sp.]
MSVSDEVIRFFESPPFSLNVGNHLNVHNPFNDTHRKNAIKAFSQKFYDDSEARIHLLGINPSRLTASSTGVNYTDGFALENSCGIENEFSKSRELTSRFFYNVVENMGGAGTFYNGVFAWAVMPLPVTREGAYTNYYQADSIDSLQPLILANLDWIKSKIPSNGRAVILGTGDNKKSFEKLPGYPFGYDRIDYLPHPRWVMQYNSAKLEKYTDMYAKVLV